MYLSIKVSNWYTELTDNQIWYSAFFSSSFFFIWLINSVNLNYTDLALMQHVIWKVTKSYQINAVSVK